MPKLFKPLIRILVSIVVLAGCSGTTWAATTGTGLSFSGNLVAGCAYDVDATGGTLNITGWRPNDFNGIGSILTSRAVVIPVTVRCPATSYMKVTVIGVADSNDAQALTNQGTATGLGVILYDEDTNFTFTPNDATGETVTVPANGTFNLNAALKQTAASVTRGTISIAGSIIIIAVP